MMPNLDRIIILVEFNANKYQTLAQQFEDHANNFYNLATQLGIQGDHTEANKHHKLAEQRKIQANFYRNLSQERYEQANKLRSGQAEIINSLNIFVNYLNQETTAVPSCQVILEFMNGILSFLQEVPPFSDAWKECSKQRSRTSRNIHR